MRDIFGRHIDFDSYIMSSRYHEEEVPHKCPKCETEWEACMFHEYGGWFYSNEDEGPYCPVCKEEGVVME